MDAPQQELTRVVYWSPSGTLNTILHQSTYLWLVIAMAVFAYGVWRHVKLWHLGKPEVLFDQPLLRMTFFFKNVLAQARVLRARRQRDPQPKSYYAAWMHGMIFYGFVALLASSEKVYSSPKRRTGSPVQRSALPMTANETPACCKI